MSQTDENQKTLSGQTSMPLLDQIRTDELTELARKRFAHHLSDAELNVLRDSARSCDPYRPHSNAPRPEIRPELLHWLASDPEAARFIDPKGIRALDITLPRVLNLAHCHIAVPLDFRRSTIKGGINLQAAVTRDIYLWECTVKGAFEADGISAHGPICLKDSGFSDTIQLRGAWIKGDLDCSGSKLNVSEGDALDAEGSKIGGNVILNSEFTSSGTIKLPGARIKGDLNCRGAKLTVENADALVAHSAEIGGNVILTSEFECSGRIWLLGTRIGGLLSFWKAQVAEVDCRNLEVSTDLVWICIQKSANTSLDLTGARVRNLREDKESWPEAGRLQLDGLVYEEITLHQRPIRQQNKMTQELDLNVEDRIQWLMLQPEKRRTEANPWMQLSKHLEGKGNRKGAKQVVYKYRCLLATEREFSPWLWLLKLLSRLKSVVICVFRPVTTFRRVWPYLRHPNRSWHIAFAWLEEVPLRICYSIAFTMMLGTAIFAGAVRSGAMMETVRILPTAVLPNGELRPVSAHYPPFQPFVYTLDNAVPLVKLGMDERWMLNPKHMPQPWFPQVGWLDGLKWLNSYSFLVWSRWGLIVWGWMQATILAASVADRFRK